MLLESIWFPKILADQYKLWRNASTCKNYMITMIFFVLTQWKCFWKYFFNRIFGSWNIGLKLYNAKFGLQIQIHFFGKARLILKLFKSFLSILELPINLFWSLWKVSVDSDYCRLEFFECSIFICWRFNWRWCITKNSKTSLLQNTIEYKTNEQNTKFSNWNMQIEM